jgi:hypothetical protein
VTSLRRVTTDTNDIDLYHALPFEKVFSGTLLHYIVLALVIGLAITLRFSDLNTVGYNSDEAVYAGQGAALAQVPVLKDLFPVFRAHPLLFQSILALSYHFGDYDVTGRFLAAAIGVATVILTYLIGIRLYGRRAALFAALFMALMPYHVVVSRQILLDGPMTFFCTLTLYFMVRFAETERPIWLIAAGAGLGLTVLSKEPSLIMVGAVYAFLALSPQIRIKVTSIILSLIVMCGIIAMFPLSIVLAGGGGSKTTQNYLIWQLLRRPNHTWDFYFLTVPPSIGVLVIVTAVIGLLLLRRRNIWSEKLLVLWIIIPLIFFELWPTKGFQYLLPIAPPLALLSGRMLAYWPEKLQVLKRYDVSYLPGLLLAVLIAITLFIPTWSQIHPSQSDTFLAGSGGVPGGREVGEWIQANVPEGATFLTIGPSMSNIIEFYGLRRSYGLSVSPNPFRRNPSYDPTLNPDFKIRSSDIQYIVWDSFSAQRTDFFSERLLAYAQHYHGRIIHTQTVTTTTPDGKIVEKPVIIVYEVRP